MFSIGKFFPKFGISEYVPGRNINLKHQPASITIDRLTKRGINGSRTRASEDVINGSVVGYDYANNTVVIEDSSSNLTKVPFNRSSVRLSQVATITRQGSSEGNRNTRVIMSDNDNRLAANSPTVRVNGSVVRDEIDVCRSSSRGSNPPEEPEEPEEPSDPEIPPPPLEPEEEPEEDDPPSKPQGCDPTSDQQWYNSTDGQGGCPTGTTYLGFAELPDGSFKVLCEGPNRPPGDGCPTVPDEYGWECIRSEEGPDGLSETCREVPNGLYATKAECESICKCQNCEDEDTEEEPEVGFVFNPGNPINSISPSCSFQIVDPENPGSTYPTEQACQEDNGLVDGQCYVVTYIFDRFPIYQVNTRTIYGPVNVTGVGCTGSLGSPSAGLYGSGRETANGPIVTKFWGGSCATLGGGQGTVTVTDISPCP